MITNGAVYPSLGAHLEHISHDYKFCRRKRDQIDHPNVYNSSANCATHTTGEWTEVLVQIQSLPKIQSLPQ